jgi:hypothetical protein
MVRFRTTAQSQADAERRARQFFAREAQNAVKRPDGTEVHIRAAGRYSPGDDLKALRQMTADLKALGPRLLGLKSECVDLRKHWEADIANTAARLAHFANRDNGARGPADWFNR